MSDKIKIHLEKALLEGFKQTLCSTQGDVIRNEIVKAMLVDGEKIAKEMLKEKDLSLNLSTVRAMYKGVAFHTGFLMSLEKYKGYTSVLPAQIVESLPLIMLLMVEEKLEKERDEIINKQVK